MKFINLLLHANQLFQILPDLVFEVMVNADKSQSDQEQLVLTRVSHESPVSLSETLSEMLVMDVQLHI